MPAEHVGEDDQVAAEIGDTTTYRREPGDDRIFALRLRRRLAIDAVHLRKQATVMLRQADDDSLPARRRPLPRQALQKPSAEGIELAHAGHVDGHVLGCGRFARHAIDLRFELAGMRGGPRAAGGKLEPFPIQFVRQ
jgi:hypothetical protein